MVEDVLSITQMQYLQDKFNVDTSKASMTYYVLRSLKDVVNFSDWQVTFADNPDVEGRTDLYHFIPAFTLSDLFWQIPYSFTLQSVVSGYEIIVKIPNWDNAVPYPKAFGRTPIECLYKMIVLLYRKNLLNRESIQ